MPKGASERCGATSPRGRTCELSKGHDPRTAHFAARSGLESWLDAAAPQNRESNMGKQGKKTTGGTVSKIDQARTAREEAAVAASKERDEALAKATREKQEAEAVAALLAQEEAAAANKAEDHVHPEGELEEEGSDTEEEEDEKDDEDEKLPTMRDPLTGKAMKLGPAQLRAHQFRRIAVRMHKLLKRMSSWGDSTEMQQVRMQVGLGGTALAQAAEALEKFAPTWRPSGRAADAAGGGDKVSVGSLVTIRDKQAKAYADVMDADDLKHAMKVTQISKGKVVVQTHKGERLFFPRGHLVIAAAPKPQAAAE